MSKVLVCFYSADGHTKRISSLIASKVNGDLFEVIPSPNYTLSDLDWTDDNSRVTREYKNPSLREYSVNIPDNLSDYDTIFIGYPIWWGIAAWPISNFVKSIDLNGKRVIPFCTSYSSGLGDSVSLLKSASNGGNWEDGFRFFQGDDSSEVDRWLKSLD